MHPVIKQILDSKRAMPLLSFPSVQLLGVPVGRLVNDSELQAEWFEQCESVGICGATSTPRWLMEQVAQALTK